MLKKTCMLFSLLFLLAFAASSAASSGPYDGLTAGGESDVGFYYTVQKGDTLSSIAQRFKGSNWAWPELWSDNVYLANPHEIYPGQVLQLFRSHGQTAPGYVPRDQDILFYYPNIDAVSFIRKTPVRSAGTVFVLNDRGTIAGAVDDLIKIALSPGARMEIGTVLTIYRPMQGSNWHINREVGDKFQIVAIGEVVRLESTVAEVKVLRGFEPIIKGDLAVFFTPRMQEIPILPSNAEVEGIIIASDENYSIMGDSMLAFINKGTKAGIMPGQFYTLYESSTYVTVEPNPPTDNIWDEITGLFNSRGVREFTTTDVVGEFIVLHAEPDAATVYILHSLKPITEGTRFKAIVY